MQHFFLVGKLSAIHDMCTVGDYFIYVHIALCTAAGLPNNKWKSMVEFAFQYLVANPCNKVQLFLG